MKKQIALLLAGVMAFSATACGVGVEDMAEASTELNVYMWPDYISEDVIQQFEEENNCTVNLSYMNSTADAVEKLKTGCGEEFDLVMVQNTDIEALADGDDLEKFKHDSLPNTSTLKDYCWISKSYGIPYLMQYLYVVYDSKTCPVEITGYGDLLNPALKGKIASVDGARNLFGVALTAVGSNHSSTEEADLEKAYHWLTKYHENVAEYREDAAQALLDGTASVALTFDRDAAKAMAKKKSIRIAAFKKHKVQALVDMFVIPAEAEHQDLAEAFLNYICDPEVMAENLKKAPYSCSNEVAEVMAPEKYKAAPERNFDYQKNVFLLRNVEGAHSLYEQYYDMLKNPPAEEME